jgi:hypothetical protein
VACLTVCSKLLPLSSLCSSHHPAHCHWHQQHRNVGTDSYQSKGQAACHVGSQLLQALDFRQLQRLGLIVAELEALLLLLPSLVIVGPACVWCVRVSLLCQVVMTLLYFHFLLSTVTARNNCCTQQICVLMHTRIVFKACRVQVPGTRHNDLHINTCTNESQLPNCEHLQHNNSVDTNEWCFLFIFLLFGSWTQLHSVLSIDSE